MIVLIDSLLTPDGSVTRHPSTISFAPATTERSSMTQSSVIRTIPSLTTRCEKFVVEETTISYSPIFSTVSGSPDFILSFTVLSPSSALIRSLLPAPPVKYGPAPLIEIFLTVCTTLSEKEIFIAAVELVPATIFVTLGPIILLPSKAK